jgi:hypothetical protein
MLIPSWVKAREVVWWTYKDGDRILCRVAAVAHEYLTLTILTATPEQVLSVRRGAGESVGVMYQDGLIERSGQ